MKETVLKCICLAALVMPFSFPKGVVLGASDVGNIMLSYDVVEEETVEAGRVWILTVRFKIMNIGENAIKNVTARLSETEGTEVGCDHIFFGLLESGETITSDSFEIVLDPGNSQDVKRHGMIWEVEYETRYGTGVVEKVQTYFQQSPDKPLQ